MALTLAEVMERTGLPASTIHHYRRAGLLPPVVATSGRCAYDPAHVEALVQIKRLRGEHGLSLRHIAEVLPALLDGDGADTACEAATARHRLLDAALRLFSSRSYGEVTIAEVAAAAGVAKGSVYRWFPSKDELFTAVVEALLCDTADGFACALEGVDGPDAARARTATAESFATVVAGAMPILLELGARAAKGHAPSQALARRVLATLAAAAGAPLVAEGADPTTAGLDLIQEAFAVVLRRSLAGPRR